MIEGYIKLAAAILRNQAAVYEEALKKWSKTKEWILIDNRVESIERELLTEYYAILTLYEIDMLDYINTQRHKYGLPEREK